jgi:hypothetical protein
MRVLKPYNTLTRKKETFKPIKAGEAGKLEIVQKGIVYQNCKLG